MPTVLDYHKKEKIRALGSDKFPTSSKVRFTNTTVNFLQGLILLEWIVSFSCYIENWPELALSKQIHNLSYAFAMY